MRVSGLTLVCVMGAFMARAQAPQSTVDDNSQTNKENIYKIKQDYLYHVLHNPAERHEAKNKKEDEDDNDLSRFNRWFNFVEPRCYPTGDLPRPDVILTETKKGNAMAASARRSASGSQRTTSTGWQPLGPATVPVNNNGVGRINCIVINPLDTNTLYVGSACGGVHISHDGGVTWASNSDNFPSLSIADIAVNPSHPDTLYAATGDGYGYTVDGYNNFWGGLYSAGVMKSTDGGVTWNTTGLSFIQTNRNVIQKLLINPNNPNILLAASTNGVYRTNDAGATWTHVYTASHIYSIAFHPGSPNTVYGVDDANLLVSNDGGTTWSVLYPGINPVADRASIAVSPAAPNAIWVLDANNNLNWSHNGGVTFFPTTTPADTANFYGYYDRVLAVSPSDSTRIFAFGMIMATSADGGVSWQRLNPDGDVHVDNHAVAVNPLHTATIYTGNDGGISVTRNNGATWHNLANGLTISQIYRMGASQQNPYQLVCGLQDNGSVMFNGTTWEWVTGGDGEDCAINNAFDNLIMTSSQNGNFYLSSDGGANFSYMNIGTSDLGSWTAPVLFDPNNSMTIYFGLEHIWVTYDQGFTFSELNTTAEFLGSGATCMAIGESNSQVLYASNQAKIFRTTDGGATWTNVTGSIPTGSVSISRIAVDPRDAMHVFVTTSGYSAGKKVWMSKLGGTTWTNISQNLPNLPANCIAIDTSAPGAIFVGTDMGVYYTDSSQTGWTLYETGLPNVIVDDIDINYTNRKVRAATYGRGVWEADLKKSALKAPQIQAGPAAISLFPNPTADNWKLQFPNQKPASFSVKVSDLTGRVVRTQINNDLINATTLASGMYNIEVLAGDARYNIKAVRK